MKIRGDDHILCSLQVGWGNNVVSIPTTHMQFGGKIPELCMMINGYFLCICYIKTGGNEWL